MLVYVETGAGYHREDAAAAWTYDLPYWGLAGLGVDEVTALTALEVATGHRMDTFTMVERIHGDELAFERDREPATSDEVAMTASLLGAAREQTCHLVTAASAAELDWADPDRRLPTWATWDTAERLAWHIADTESRFYLPALGLPPRSRAADLLTELRESHAHVLRALAELPPDAVRQRGGEEWTTVKVLRRLAWHEAGELAVLRRLLARARHASSGRPASG